MIETRTVTKGTNRLLIATSISVLAGLALLVFNDQGTMPTVIEQEQRMESRRVPDHQLELTGYGEMRMISGEDLRKIESIFPKYEFFKSGVCKKYEFDAKRCSDEFVKYAKLDKYFKESMAKLNQSYYGKKMKEENTENQQQKEKKNEQLVGI